MELYTHQQEILDENRPKLGLFHAPGLGKTITLLELCKKNNVQALIICPKGIKKQWEEYVKSYSAKHVVYTKEEFRKLHKEIPKYNAFIFDEAHHASNMKSQLTKACLWYLKAHNVHYRWLATGTPYRSSAMNIYALGQLLGYQWNYWTFFTKFFTMVRMGTRQVPVALKGKEKELEYYVNIIGVTLALDKVLDVPEQTYTTEILPLTEEQIQAEKELSESTPIARFTKKNCIHQGFTYGDEYTIDKIYESNKTKRIIELCKKHKTIAIVARYTLQIELLQKILSKTFSRRPIFVISGATKDRYEIVNKINSLDDCIVLLQSSCSEGYSLFTINCMLFASLDWSFLNYEQMKSRILRMNALKENTYYHLVSGDTDQTIHKTIMEHRDFHLAIYYKDIDNINV